MASVVLSLLPLVTVSALALLVPASVMMLSRRSGRHSAVTPGGERWALLALAAATVTIGALAGALAIGTGPGTAAVSAILLGAAVLAWAPLTRTWPVLGVTVWALVVAAAGGLVASATAAALVVSAAWAAAGVSAVGAALLVPALGFVHRRLRGLLGVRAGARKVVRLPVYLRPWLLRPAIALGVFVAAFSVTGLTGDGLWADDSGAPEAGLGTGVSVDQDDDLDPATSRLVSSTSQAPSAAARDAGPTTGPAARAEAGSSGAAGVTGDAAPSPTRSLRAPSSDVADNGSTSGTTTPSGGSGTSTASPSPQPTTEVTTSTNVESVNETVEDVVEPVVDTVEEVTEPVTETVEEVTEPVTEPVEDAVDPVVDAVEDVTDPVEETVTTVTDPVTSLLP